LLLLLLSLNLSFTPWITTDVSDSVECQIFPKLYSWEGDVYMLAGLFYYGRSKGALKVIKNGKEIFDVQLKYPVYYGFNQPDDKVIVAGEGSDLFVYSLNGELIKKVEMKERVRDILTIQDYVILMEGGFNAFEIFKKKGLKQISKQMLAYCLFGSSPGYAVYDEKLYLGFGSQGNKISCYDIERNKFIWTIDLGMRWFAVLWIFPFPNVVSSMEATQEGIFVGTMVGGIFELDEKGNILREGSVGRGRMVTSIKVVDIGRDESKELLVATYNGELILMDRKSLKILWSLKMEGESCEPPLVLNIKGKSKILAVDKKGNIFLIKPNGEIEDKVKIENDKFTECPYILAGDVDKNGSLDLILKGSMRGILYRAETDIPVEKGSILRDER